LKKADKDDEKDGHDEAWPSALGKWRDAFYRVRMTLLISRLINLF